MLDRRTVRLHQARQILLSTCSRIEDVESIPISNAIDRVTNEAVRVSSDVPPLPIARCDGYAVKAKDTTGASKDSSVKLGVAWESSNAVDKPLADFCTVFVKKGQYLPPNAEAIVQKKDYYREQDSPIVSITRPYGRGDNIETTGHYFAENEIVFKKGQTLSVDHVRLAAVLNFETLRVLRKPKISLLFSSSNNDKSRLAALDIWLRSSVENAGGILEQVKRINSGRLQVEQALCENGAAADLIIILLDDGEPTEPVLQALKTSSKVLFERINARPLGPSTLGYRKDIPVLLCGIINMEMTIEMLVRPAIKEMLGTTDHNRRLVDAKSAVSFNASLGAAAFVPAICEYKDCTVWVRQAKTSTPWDYNTQRPDGYILVQDSTNAVRRGDTVDFLLITQ